MIDENKSEDGVFESKNYRVKVRITDRFRKPNGMKGNDVKERFGWEEDVEIFGCDNEKTAALAAQFQINKTWESKRYSVKTLAVEEV